MNFIRLKKNNLFIENLLAQKLAKKYKTPFYCYSYLQLKNNYHALNNAFKPSHTRPNPAFIPCEIPFQAAFKGAQGLI